MTEFYGCYSCGWHGNTLPSDDWRCPQCNELLGGSTNVADELAPGDPRLTPELEHFLFKLA
jgi:hypothetical protein